MPRKKAYLISFMMQQKQVEKLCWGESCGKGQACRALDLGDSMGNFILCLEKSCPFEEKRANAALKLEGYSLDFRKLKES